MRFLCSERIRLVVLLGVTLAAMAVPASAASAAATPGPFYFQVTTVGPADPQPCTGVPGTNTSTVTVQGHLVANADGTFHVFEDVTQDYREDWTDGTYLISQAVSHQSFNTNATGTANFSGAEQDRGTLYAPTGQILGYSDIFTEFHIAFANGTLTSLTHQFRIISNPCP